MHAAGLNHRRRRRRQRTDLLPGRAEIRAHAKDSIFQASILEPARLPPVVVEYLEFALGAGVDAVSQSFVENATEIEEVRHAAAELGNHALVIAKIERADALDGTLR